MRDSDREAEKQAEGEAGSMQGARRGTQSWVSRIAPQAKGRSETAEPPRDPRFVPLKIYLKDAWVAQWFSVCLWLRYESWGPGSLGGTAVWRRPLAQGAILETPDRIPHQAPGAWSLPSPSACVSASLSLSLL